MPIYDYKTTPAAARLAPGWAPMLLVIVEGILVFVEPSLRALLDINILLCRYTDADIRVMRRIRRDVEQRGDST